MNPLVFRRDKMNMSNEEDEELADPTTTPLWFMDKAFVSFVYLTVCFSLGFVMNIAPKFAAKIHGVSEKEQLNHRAIRTCSQIGAGYFSTGLLFYCLLIEKTSLFKAVQLIYAFWFYHQARIIVANDYEDPSMMWGSVGIFGFVVAAMELLPENKAKLALQVISAIWVAQAPMFIFAPDTAKKFWKSNVGDPKDNESTAFALASDRLFGFWLLSAALNTGALSLGATEYEAIGHAAICCGMWIVSGVLSGELKAAGMDLKTMLVWLLFDIFVAYALLV